jgi:hypothetical protein
MYFLLVGGWRFILFWPMCFCFSGLCTFLRGRISSLRCGMARFVGFFPVRFASARFVGIPSAEVCVVPRVGGGFALVLSLMVLLFLVLVGFVLAAWLALGLRLSGGYGERVRAHLVVVAGARMALGDLQLRLGGDRVVSFPFVDPVHGAWVGVARSWELASGDGRAVRWPLVSGNHYLVEDLLAGRAVGVGAPFGWALFSAGGDGGVRVPWVGAGGGERFCYWVEDESFKVDVGVSEAMGLRGLADDLLRWQLVGRRHEGDAVLGVRRGAGLANWVEGLSYAGNWAWLGLAWRKGAVDGEVFRLDRRWHTWGSYGVLADALNGGLRVNWDQSFPELLADEDLPCSRLVWDDFFHPSELFKKRPWGGLAVRAGSGGEMALRRFPILSGLRGRFGFFNTRSDGQHRTRYVVEAQFWNPLAYPLVCVDGARMGVFDFERMPVIEITNLNTGGLVSVDMSAFPIGRVGLVSQTESDLTANAWAEFFDGRRFGMSAPGLLAGENYNFFLPNPRTQPHGLARTLTATTWKMQSDPNKPNTPPSGANGNNWFHASHTISIRGKMPEGGVTLHVREARGPWLSSVYPSEYSPPVLTLKNIPYKDFQIHLSGAEYNLARSDDYRPAMARLGFNLHLRPGAETQLAKVFETLDPREPVLDFARPEVLALYEIDPDPSQRPLRPLAMRLEESFWWDAQENSHGDGPDSYADLRSLDQPSHIPPLTPAVLRHLPRAGKNAGALNPRYPQGRAEDTRWYDRAFYAGAWAPPEPPPEASRHWTRNPWLQRIPGPDAPKAAELARHAHAAAHIFQRGTFNANSPHGEAWRILLARTLPQWQRQAPDDGTSSVPPKDLSNTQLRLAYGATQPQQNATPQPPLQDDDFFTATKAEQARATSSQGLRALSPARRDKLAHAIAAAITEHHQQFPRAPFHSLAHFAQSPVLATAIRAAELNAPPTLPQSLHPASPLHLNPGDLLETLLPILSVRGDTYQVHLRAQIQEVPLPPKSQAHARIVVQRLPSYCDPKQPPNTPPQELSLTNRHLGRRLKIISIQYLNNEDE